MKFAIFFVVFYIHTDARKSDGHSGQKKQYVNFGDGGDEGYDNSYSKGYGGGGYDDDEGMYGGAGAGGRSEGYDGGMQLRENEGGGINLQGGNIDSLAALLGGSPNQYGGGLGGNEDMGGLSQYASPADQSQFESQSDQSMSALGGGGYGALGRGESLYSSMDDGNDGNDDILSPFDANSLEGKLEHSINLGDNVNTPGVGQFDMNTFDDFGNSRGKGQSALLQEYQSLKHKHKQGEDRQGIGGGNGEVQDLLTNELGELDTSDEKLQKMLESGLNSDNNYSPDSGNGGVSGVGTAAGGGGEGTNSENALSALLNPQGQMDQMDSQPSTAPDEMPSIFGGNNNDNQETTNLQQSALNQLSGTMSQQANPENVPQPVNHAHASDKPGSSAKDAPPPEEARQTAQQVQENATKEHRKKLVRLRGRLKDLKQKLRQLEEEQAKKSTSNKNNDPKTARNDAIKKLLIKNLKLAAMIASKEIQLEEAKGRGLAYLSGKKEEDADTLDSVNHEKQEQGYSKAKPLTELSKKAEEEVNHLSKNPDMDKMKLNNNSIINFMSNIRNIKNNSNYHNTTIEGSNTFLRRINETLQVLDRSSPEVHTRSTLTASSRRFLKKLQSQIQSMSAPQAQIVEEKALATLYRAIKTKAVNAAKRRFVLKQQLARARLLHKGPRQKHVKS